MHECDNTSASTPTLKFTKVFCSLVTGSAVKFHQAPPAKRTETSTLQ